MPKVISAAVQADADICNAMEPPTQGVAVGGGRHIVIPADWQTRIAAGQDVPGCTYAKPLFDGTMFVSDQVQAKLLVPAEIAKLTGAAALEVPSLNTKLSGAVVVSGAAKVGP